MNVFFKLPIDFHRIQNLLLDHLMIMIEKIKVCFETRLITIICLCLIVLLSSNSNAQSFELENRFKQEVIVRSAHDPSYNQIRQHYLNSVNDIRNGGGVIITSSLMFVMTRAILAKGEKRYGINTDIEENRFDNASTILKTVSVISGLIGILRYREGLRAKRYIVKAYYAPGYGSVLEKPESTSIALSLDESGLTLKLIF